MIYFSVTTLLLLIFLIILILFLKIKNFKSNIKYINDQNFFLLESKNYYLDQIEKLKEELNNQTNIVIKEKSQNSYLEKEIDRLNIENLNIKAQYSKLTDNSHEQIKILSEDNILLRSDISKLEENLNFQLKNYTEKLSFINKIENRFAEQFENLAHRIFTDNQNNMQNQNSNVLDNVLKNFKNDIKIFREKVEELYIDEAKERISLKTEVNRLFSLNQTMSKDARNLVSALKGDNKIQGKWGEVILENILDCAGLRKGYEYESQSSYNVLDHDNKNKVLRPDIVIHLPGKKDLVIDSKVSLTYYERYIKADSTENEKLLLKKHNNSIRQHVNSLSKKSYETIKSINLLDFTLMFIPIESAFILTIQNDDFIFQDAFNKKIIIVTPTTLLSTLSTIKHMWKYENVSKNTVMIVDRATKMLDKFSRLLEDLSSLGKQIEKSNNTYHDIMNKLFKGRGNLISHAKHLEDMGIQVKKSLNNDFFKD